MNEIPPTRFAKLGTDRIAYQIVGNGWVDWTTEAAPKLNKKTGMMPTEEELVRMGQRVRPIMTEILEAKGLVEVAEDKVYVTKLKGPLEDGWQKKVEDFAARLSGSVAGSG